MGDNRFSCASNGNAGGFNGRESFGIEASRILDACRDRDCFGDVRVFLTTAGEELIARAGNVRVKCAKIVASNILVDPVQFNCGFYTVLVRFYVNCRFEVCVAMGQSQEIEGIAVLEKRVVLFGGESNISVFRSEPCGSFCAIPEPVCCGQNAPEAVVEVVAPVVLGAHIMEEKERCHCCCCCCDIPTVVADSLCGTLEDRDGERFLTISLGIFSVIRLVRPGQLLVQATEFCLPDKECTANCEEDPCGTFRNMPFPTAEFCPNTIAPTLGQGGGRGRCCGKS